MVVVEDGIAECRRLRMKGYSLVVTGLIAGTWLMTSGLIADAAPCLIVTLTGTQGGPQSFNGLAAAGNAGALWRRRQCVWSCEAPVRRRSWHHNAPVAAWDR